MFSVVVLLTVVVKCVAAAVVMSALWTLVSNFRSVKMVKQVPGPPGKPLIGHVWDMWVPFEDILGTMLNLLKDFRKEPVVKLRLATTNMYMLQTGSAAEVILKDPRQVNKADAYYVAENYLRRGLLTSLRNKWEKRRKMINHSFHVRILEGFLHVFNEKAEILVKKLENLEFTGTFDVAPVITLCALDIICETTMGYPLNSQENSDIEFVKALHGLQTCFVLRVFRPWLRPNFVYNLTKYKKIEDSCLKTILSFNKEVIRNRRVLLEEEKRIRDEQPELEDGMVGKRRLAFLDLLLEGKVDGKSLTDEDVLEEVNISMHAGHETTASAITFTLFLLGLHQDVQKRVQEEIESVMGDEDRAVTSADLVKLKFLEAVIKETMRLYPSVPLTGRTLSEDAIISGYRIPTGSYVFFPFIIIHRDPEVFPDPDKFHPERFYGETAQKLTPYEFLPFSAGPRNCIGHKFAMMELKTVLTQIFRKFTVVSHQKPEELKLTAAPVLQSVQGTIISLQRKGHLGQAAISP